MRTTALALATVGTLAAAACGDRGTAAAATTIAVIPKGTTHEFWKAVRAGAQRAAGEFGVAIVWKGPSREDDREGQVSVVEDAIARGVDGIVLAPLDEKALVPVAREANAQGIPLVVIDSGLDAAAPRVAFVATDNRAAGSLAARRLGERLAGRGKVLVLRYQEGSASTAAREAGFLHTLSAEFPAVELVSSNQYGGATTETAYQASENLLVRFAQLDGVFTPNESTTMGMLRALQDSGRAGRVVFVGFDASSKLVQALERGEIDALVLQDPLQMGYRGVGALVAHLRGQPSPGVVDTGATIATKDNMQQPRIRALLEPATAEPR